MVTLGEPTPDPGALQVYLLGSLEFDDALRLQRSLVYQVRGDRARSALVLCGHPPLITVGRHGSPAQLDLDPDDRDPLPVRWVSRGGGCLLHLPGQLAIYPILPLDRLRLGVGEYIERLHKVLLAVLDDFSIVGEVESARPDVRVGGRPVAFLGVSVRDWVSHFGAVLNVDPDLTLAREVMRLPEDRRWTSVARERHGPLRPALLRERVVEHFGAVFGMDRREILFHHPATGTRGERLVS